jgi:hypothetical protein
MSNKKYIIIIGEEYWFDVKYQQKRWKEEFEKSKYLLKTLKNNDSKYEYKILNGPKNLVKNIEEIGYDNIKAIFFFHDVFSDSILNNMTIKEIKDYLRGIEKKHNIFMYPGLENTLLFASKKYYDILSKKLPHTILPKSEVLTHKDYKGYKDEKVILRKLYKLSKNLLKDFEKIVIKKGFSYEGKQVKVITKELISDYGDFTSIARRLNLKKFWGIKSNAIDMDVGMDRYYILQGFNSKVTSEFNEFRVFFINGKATYITWKDQFDNLCTNDISKNIDEEIIISNKGSKMIDIKNYDVKGEEKPKVTIKKEINKNLLIEVLRFAKKTYSEFLPLFWKYDDKPILLRLDISYATEPQFLDNQAIDIEGFKTKVRLYINEIEIDPTNYFYNNLLCKNNKDINNKYLQELFGNVINRYITRNIK